MSLSLCSETISTRAKQQRRGFQKSGSSALPRHTVDLLPSQKKSFTSLPRSAFAGYPRKKSSAPKQERCSFASLPLTFRVHYLCVCGAFCGCWDDAGSQRPNPRGCCIIHCCSHTAAGLEDHAWLSFDAFQRVRAFASLALTSGSHAQGIRPWRKKARLVAFLPITTMLSISIITYRLSNLTACSPEEEAGKNGRQSLSLLGEPGFD